MMLPPALRGDDHVHPETWTRAEQHRFEDGVKEELKELNAAITSLTRSVLLMLGALALIAFLLPVLAPFIRQLIGPFPIP